MNDDTRCWLASDIADSKLQHNEDNLLSITKLQAGKNPRNFITDGLPACMKSSKKVFEKKTNHVRHVHLAGKRDRDNNKMERLNGKIRDREKVFRGLKKMDTPVSWMACIVCSLHHDMVPSQKDGYSCVLDGMRVLQFHQKARSIERQNASTGLKDGG